MSAVIDLDLGATRAEDFFRLFEVAPGGQQQDLTGWLFIMSLHRFAGADGAPDLDVSSIASAAGSVVTLEDAAAGNLSVLIKMADLQGLPGSATDLARFAYNLNGVDPAGIRRPYARGHFTIEPGV